MAVFRTVPRFTGKKRVGIGRPMPWPMLNSESLKGLKGLTAVQAYLGLLLT